MIELAALSVFPLLMAFAASSDLLTMTISNRVSIALLAGCLVLAAALGLPFLLTLRRVILPQAMRAIVPPMTGNCVSMFKDTSLASTVALPELLNEATNSQALHANPSPLIMAAIIYVIFLWPMVRLVSVLEQRFKMSGGR